MKNQCSTDPIIASAPYFLVVAVVSGLSLACVKPAQVRKNTLSPPTAELAKADLRDAVAGTDSEAISAAQSRTRARIRTVKFAFDNYALDNKARKTLKTNAEILRENEGAQILVEGYCDPRGTAEYNLALGERRASVVRDYYRMLGIDSDRVKTISYGEEKPICIDETDDCRRMSRRATTVVVDAAK